MTSTIGGGVVLNVLTMSLYRFFAKASKWSDLPNPSGPLSASVSPATIKDANDAVKSVTSEGKSKRRGSYAKFTAEQQAAIGKYASIKRLFGTSQSSWRLS